MLRSEVKYTKKVIHDASNEQPGDARKRQAIYKNTYNLLIINTYNLLFRCPGNLERGDLDPLCSSRGEGGKISVL